MVNAMHQCLFCQQTFDSAAAKDDHILEHFDQEKCTECNEDLIRIGGYLYARHDEATCIKKTVIPEVSIESCTFTKSIQATSTSHTLTCNLRNANESSRSFDAAHTLQVKVEPEESDASVSGTSGSEMMSSVLVDGLSIQQRFPNVNLNPVVVLEDILKKIDTVRPPELKRCKMETDPDLQSSVHFIDENNKDKTYVCETAAYEKTYRSEESFQLNGDKEHDTPAANYSCYICSEVFNVKTSLVEHIEEKHENFEIRNTEEKPTEQVGPQHDQSVLSIIQNEGNSTGVEYKTDGEEMLIELDTNGQPDNRDEWDDCDETFEMQHLNKYNEAPYHDEIGEFNCEIGLNLKCCYRECEQRFENQQDRILHIQNHHNEKHICSFDGCGKQFMFRSVLELHQMKEHSSEMLYNCTYEHCKKRFKTRAQKSRHIYNVHSRRSQKELTSSQNLEFHRANEQSISTFDYPCDICPEIFSRKDTLMKHVAEKHPTFEIRNTEEQPIQHQKEQSAATVASSIQKEGNLNGPNFEIKVEEQLIIEPQANEPDSHEELSHEWIDGDETLVSQNPAESHYTRPNTGSGEFVCTICKRTFTERWNLKVHIASIHGSNTKIFTCDICGVSGFYRRELQVHIESVHSNIRKHKCHACGKPFRNSTQLKRHMRIHVKIRPFICGYEQCGKRFLTNALKVQHERVHTGEKPFICDIDECKCSFIDSRGLNAHRNKEHGISIVSYSCGFCPRIYKIKSRLVKHIQENHSHVTDPLCHINIV